MNNTYNRTWGAIILLICAACAPEMPKMKRVSEDKSNAIAYLFDDVAITRANVDNGVITLNGSRKKVFYDLVTARWLNKPTLSSSTGDEITHTYVSDLLKLNYVTEKKVVYGIGYVNKTDTENRSIEEGCFVFIYHNGNINCLPDQQSLGIYLKNIGVKIESMKNPEILFEK